MPEKKSNASKFIFSSLAFIGCGVVVYYGANFLISEGNIEYNIKENVKNEQKILDDKTSGEAVKNIDESIVDNSTPMTHIETPENVKALYMSSWVAGSANFRNSLVKIVDDTELNAVVIDVKDSTGRISYYMNDPLIKELGSAENRIGDIRGLISLLHSKNIYVIGRISVFQDPYLTKKKPEWAIKRISNGEVWKDRKGLSFLDPTNKEVHNYIITVATNAYNDGFDEINFDYIRYPSDGDIKDINYNLSSGKNRASNMKDFFKYLSSQIKAKGNIPISADVFGLTTEATDDMGIGQVWEKIIPYFDFVCPMVYLSHYPSGHAGYKNPAAYPYEVINKALQGAINKTNAIKENPKKIRPWLQDFDLGATYTKDMIILEKKAVYDNKLGSWMLWDPSNKYTPSALDKDAEVTN